MICNERFLITYLIIGYLIIWCSSGLTLIESCSKWNISNKIILFGDQNGTAGNDSSSLNLMNSSLVINRNTGEIAVLDDNNHRVLSFNQSNTSTLFAILSDSSNSTNRSMVRFSPSAITYDSNNLLYILDGWNKQLTKMKNPLEYGENATSFNVSFFPNATLPLSNTTVGLCVDAMTGNIFISDYYQNQIMHYRRNISSLTLVAAGGGGLSGNWSRNPTSIVIDDNRTLFVNDVGHNRIQMFTYIYLNGTTLPFYINGCIGLSFYPPDILLLNTKTAVYLFNLTDNKRRCLVGCNGPELTDIHNALIDNNGSLIVTASNQVLSYSMYHECSEDPTGPTTTTTVSSFFNPINTCTGEKFGVNCSTSNNICDLTQPCLNSVRCIENNTSQQGYTCECLEGFEGFNCENDRRLCKPFTCLQHGNCTNKTKDEYECICYRGYEGKNCEKTIDFCANITCQNRGVCSPHYLNYTCNCLAGTHGRHCEMIETSAVVRGYIRKGFGYIAIIMLASLIGFIVIMDILKYGFGIDPVEADRKAVKKKRIKKKAVQRPKVAYRFQYVN